MNSWALPLLACCLCALLTQSRGRELSQATTITRTVSSGAGLTSSTTTTMHSTLGGTTLSRRFPSGFGASWWRPAPIKPIKPLLPITPIQPSTPIQPTPAQPSTPTTPVPVSSDGGCRDPQAALSTMNAARARRGSPPLTWSAELARGALSWSSACVFQHSHNGLGENLAKFSSPSATLTDAVTLWLDEERLSYGGRPPAWAAGVHHAAAA
ncbi:hypothetical protein D9Q98_006153 [Chlorella vulgaris]|uniref:SCP domain-containing protein n=1 Tax=Chlorella vulgaris TaxID=3077 RepID=A0A9D4Z198_CHLVU|nr:hypothetical protein D9Q98_006153 [Chlorella vulgaris]